MKNELLEKCDWWRQNKAKHATSTIEWTYEYNGWVRAKLDSITTWSYKKCSKAMYAEAIGKRLIYKQKKWRQHNEEVINLPYTAG